MRIILSRRELGGDTNAMLDLNKAYSLLGLHENATEEEVEKRYEILLRRKKGRSEEEDRAAGEPTMAEITEAYNTIKGTKLQELIKEKEPKSKSVQRAGHIWEYYRWHIIGSIVAIVLIIYTFTSIMDNRNEAKRIERADVKINFFADFQVENADPLEVKLLQDLKDWKDVHFIYQYAPTDPKDEYGMAMLQKAMISMAADKVDVYITDPANFQKFGSQGAFLKLDEIPGLSGLADAKKLKLNVDGEGQVWAGIDVTDSPALQELKLPPGTKIAAIRVNADKKDNAAKTLEWLTKH